MKPTPETKLISEFEEAYFKQLKIEGMDVKAKGAWQKMYAHYIDTIFKLRKKTILDLGCAMGSITSSFADYNIEAIGVDISEFATSNSPFKNIKLFNKPAWDLSDIPDNSVDFIHSMNMFEYIPSDKRELMFSEIRRVAKNECVMFVILQLGIGKKGMSINLSPKYEWDEIAAKYGMLDGARSYYNKLMETNVPGWEFMKFYNWPFLCYQIIKEME